MLARGSWHLACRMLHCAPDAERVAPVGGGCSGPAWEHAVQAIATFQPVLINVGANKGYRAVSWLALWRGCGARGCPSPFSWYRLLIRYVDSHPEAGRFTRARFLGACRDGYAKVVPGKDLGRHVTSTPVAAHLLEIMNNNRKMLRWVANESGLAATVRVHDLGASNVSGTVSRSRQGASAMSKVRYQVPTPRHAHATCSRRNA